MLLNSNKVYVFQKEIIKAHESRELNIQEVNLKPDEFYYFIPCEKMIIQGDLLVQANEQGTISKILTKNMSSSDLSLQNNQNFRGLLPAFSCDN